MPKFNPYSIPLAAAFAAALLAGCGGHHSSFHPPVSTVKAVWVTNSVAITGFAPAAEADGNIEPSRMIVGSNTTFVAPTTLAFDQSGKMYVADFTSNAIDVFAQGVTGNVAPVRRIVGGATGINSPMGIGVDSNGNIYVANRDSNNITVYSSSANGNAAPIRTIGGTLTFLSSPQQLVVLPSGAFYVICAGSNKVNVFAAGASGNVDPMWSLNVSLGAGMPDGLALDSTGKIYVCTTDTIGVYAAGASGSAAPLRTIAGPSTGISFLEGLAVDDAGNIYASDNDDEEFLIFDPEVDGDVPPTRRIAGSFTHLQSMHKPAIG